MFDVSVIVYPDPELPTCLQVRGPRGATVRLVPALLPDHFTAHFLEGDLPTAFKGASHTGTGIPCETKDKILGLLVAEWATQKS